MSEKSESLRLVDDLAAITPSGREQCEVYALLRSHREGSTKDGKAYADVEFGDQTAIVRGKVWSESASALEELRGLKVGDPVKIRFEAGTYDGSLQLNVKLVRSVDEEKDSGFRAEALYGPNARELRDLICQTLVFDIETVPAFNKRKLPNTVAESLTKYAERKDMDTDKAMGLSPFFGKVVSLAIGEGEADSKDQRVTVLVVPPEGSNAAYPDWIRPMTEADLLRAFWTLASVAETVVSFNGRGFDVPFLVTRSLILDVPARIDLLSRRNYLRPHLDLCDFLRQGSYSTGPTSLDVVCWSLGIESPKGQMDGSMVAPAYEKGQLQKIAEYNREDVIATSRVYHHVRDKILAYRKDW